MRKLILKMDVSLDGFCCGLNGDEDLRGHGQLLAGLYRRQKAQPGRPLVAYAVPRSRGISSSMTSSTSIAWWCIPSPSEKDCQSSTAWRRRGASSS